MLRRASAVCVAVCVSSSLYGLTVRAAWTDSSNRMD